MYDFQAQAACREQRHILCKIIPQQVRLFPIPPPRSMARLRSSSTFRSVILRSMHLAASRNRPQVPFIRFLSDGCLKNFSPADLCFGNWCRPVCDCAYVARYNPPKSIELVVRVEQLIRNIVAFPEGCRSREYLPPVLRRCSFRMSPRYSDEYAIFYDFDEQRNHVTVHALFPGHFNFAEIFEDWT